MAKKENIWNDANVALLTKMWDEGKTAADIAEALGGITRNSVIGKANRLGLEKRPSPIKKAKTTKKTVVEDNDSLDDDSDLMDAKSFSILDIKEGMCRWPVGDPQDEDFHFCGKKALEGCPYCDKHATEAYQVPNKR